MNTFILIHFNFNLHLRVEINTSEFNLNVILSQFADNQK